MRALALGLHALNLAAVAGLLFLCQQLLRAHDALETVIAVGHEPHLSTLATYLMCGSEDSRVEMKKGGACLLVFDKRAKRGAGTLRWLMGPKQLARQA